MAADVHHLEDGVSVAQAHVGDARTSVWLASGDLSKIFGRSSRLTVKIS